MVAPRVSVVIPTYNRRMLLERALASVLAQTRRDFEIIVVDDGSTDDTKAMVQAHAGARYFFQANAGPAKARNTGIRAARGDLIAFLDSDDVWLPNFLEVQTDVLERHRQVALSCTASKVGNKEAKHFSRAQELFVGDLYGKLYAASFVRTPATMVRKSCLADVGYFNEAYRWCEDVDLWLRIARKYPIAYVSRCLVNIGRQDDNLTGDLNRRLDEHLKVALEVLRANYDPSRIASGVHRARVSTKYLQFSRLYFMRGENAEGWCCLRHAIRAAPYTLRPYRYVLKRLFSYSQALVSGPPLRAPK
jgi:glycosyltransferase involved in cell wall biosynthesis